MLMCCCTQSSPDKHNADVLLYTVKSKLSLQSITTDLKFHQVSFLRLMYTIKIQRNSKLDLLT